MLDVEEAPLDASPAVGPSGPVDPSDPVGPDHVEPGPFWTRRPRPSRRTKVATLLIIAGLGLLIRVVLVTNVHPICPAEDQLWTSGRIMEYQNLQDRLNEPVPPLGACITLHGDPLYTVAQARMIADGQGMSSPILFGLTDRLTPGAARPPAWTLAIAGLDKLGLQTPTEARLLACLLGALAIVVIGHLGWQLGGRWAGTAAAIFAAINPSLFINDWRLLNDGPYALVVALMLWLAYRLWSRPTIGRAVALGAIIALGYYTRSEAASLLAFLVVPLVLGLRAVAMQRRLLLGGVAVLCGLLLIGPYWIWNVNRFHHPHMTLGSGVVLLNASCDTTYFGDKVGMVGFACFDAASKVSFVKAALDPEADESDIDDDYGAAARPYVSENQRRLPYVAAIRVARVYNLYAPGQTAQFDVTEEYRGSWEPWFGLPMFYALIPFSIAGLVHLRRRRIPISPFVAMFLSVTFTVATTFGLTRFRVPVDVAMCILGGVGFAAFDTWYRTVSRDRRVGASDDGHVRATVGSAVALARDAVGRVRRASRAIVAGALVVVVLLFGGLVWSAGAQPIPKAPKVLYDISGSTPATILSTCQALEQQWINLYDFVHHASEGVPVYPDSVIAALDTAAQDVTIPQIADDLRILQGAATRSRDTGKPLIQIAGEMDPAQHDRYVQAIERVLFFSGEHCHPASITAADVVARGGK